MFLALPLGSDASEPTLRLRTELEAAGHAVGQPEAAPITEAEARTRLDDLLTHARAAVHVVGRKAGTVLREGKVLPVQLQLEASARRADADQASAASFLVLASHVQAHPEHHSFIDRLQIDLAEGGLLRPTDTLVLEQPGGMTVQEFVQIVREGLAG